MDLNPDSSVIEHKAQLIEYLASGCKTPEDFRLGAEQEWFLYTGTAYQPTFYDGPDPSIRKLLEGMTGLGWQPIEENGNLIALSRGACGITLEPGGQFEFVGSALENAHQTRAEIQAFCRELESLAGELGLSLLALGHQPKHSRRELPWMPKERYRVMRSYMPSRGDLGLDMMQRTCATQVTADFSNEADMVKKFRVALALQPIVVALFANSPFKDGRVGECLSHRSAVWGDTDSDRCGSLPFVFQNGMGFERYVDWALDVPMYFVIRNRQFIDASGLSFRDFMKGRLSVLPGQLPMVSDWANHLSTVFPQVRLKQFLEFRGADAGDAVNRLPALVALWAGLLYDPQSLATAWDRIQDWAVDERLELESNVARSGFATPFRKGTLQDLALWMLELSRDGLERRGICDEAGSTESQYLQPLQQAAESGQTFADQLIQNFSTQWHKNMDIALPAMCKETFS